MTGRLPFTEQAVRRAVKAARSAGMKVAGFTVAKDGAITVYDADAPVAPLAPGAHHGASSEFEDFEA
jgi:hypothetical protein